MGEQTSNMCLHSNKLAISAPPRQRAPAGYPPSRRTATVSALAALPARCNPAECHSSTLWEQISPVSPAAHSEEQCLESGRKKLLGQPAPQNQLFQALALVWCPICNEQNTKRSLRCSDCGSTLHGEGHPAPRPPDLVHSAQSNSWAPSNTPASNRPIEVLRTITHKGVMVADQQHVYTPPEMQPSACLLSSLPELRLPTSFVRARRRGDTSSLTRQVRVAPETRNNTDWTSSEQREQLVNRSGGDMHASTDSQMQAVEHSPIHRFDRQLFDEMSPTGAYLQIDGSHIPVSSMLQPSGNCELRILEGPGFDCNNNPRDSSITCA